MDAMATLRASIVACHDASEASELPTLVGRAIVSLRLLVSILNGALTTVGVYGCMFIIQS